MRVTRPTRRGGMVPVVGPTTGTVALLAAGLVGTAALMLCTGGSAAARQAEGQTEPTHSSAARPALRHDAPDTCFGMEATIRDLSGALVKGTSGDDVIIASGPVFAGAGDDAICWSHDVHGQLGDDRIILQGRIRDGQPIRAGGGAGADDIRNEINLLQQGATRVEIRGSGGDDDLLSFGTAHETMYGGAGADEIRASRGADRIYGGAGDDELFGGKGNDQIWGDPGDDRVWGEPGDDTLRGGLGRDDGWPGLGDDRCSGFELASC